MSGLGSMLKHCQPKCLFMKLNKICPSPVLFVSVCLILKLLMLHLILKSHFAIMELL